jgi:hypothetical protein
MVYPFPADPYVAAEDPADKDVTHYREDDDPESLAGEFVPDNFIDPFAPDSEVEF